MLVLTRKPGEAIRLGPDITLTVLSVDGQNVRLGIEAPAGVKITRPDP